MYNYILQSIIWYMVGLILVDKITWDVIINLALIFSVIQLWSIIMYESSMNMRLISNVEFSIGIIGLSILILILIRH